MNDGALKTSGNVNSVLGSHRSDAKRWEKLKPNKSILKISLTNLYGGCRRTRRRRRCHCVSGTKVRGRLGGGGVVAAREIVAMLRAVKVLTLSVATRARGTVRNWTDVQRALSNLAN